MNYSSIQLNDLLNAVGKEKVKEILSDFSCPKNKDIENFLKNKAIDFERTNLARTTLVFYKEDTNSYPILVAYYSITISKISVENVSKGYRKKLTGTTYPIGKEINSLLIGQLSKNFKNGNNKLISGKKLMSLIFEKIYKINIIVPSVLTYIDCQDTEHLKKYYESFGFEYFRTNEHKDEKLLCYVIQTKKIIDVIENENSKSTY